MIKISHQEINNQKTENEKESENRNIEKESQVPATPETTGSPQPTTKNEPLKVVMRPLTESEIKQLKSRKGKGRRSGFDYVKTVIDFLNSGSPFQDVEVPGLLMDTLYSGLKCAIKREKITNVTCKGLNRRIVLERTDLAETST